MKSFAYIQLCQDATDVFVSESEHVASILVAGATKACPSVSEGVRVAFERLLSGRVASVNNQLGSMMLLGPVVGGIVEIKHHKMFLVTIGRKNSYWLTNNDRFQTAQCLEKFLSIFPGAEDFEWSPVSETYMAQVIQNLNNLESIMPKIVVVLDDGMPVSVQIGGVAHSSIRVQVLNIQHRDDHQGSEDCQGVLTYANGAEFKRVIDCTPAVEFFDSAEHVASFI